MPTETAPATGTFCWNELMTPDVDAAKSFYSQLFGWESKEMDMGPQGTYTIYSAAGKDCAGMMKTPNEHVPPNWLAYVTVEDVDASTSKAEGLGATVCVKPTDIPGMGRFSVIIDPTKAAIGLFQGT